MVEKEGSVLMAEDVVVLVAGNTDCTVDVEIGGSEGMVVEDAVVPDEVGGVFVPETLAETLMFCVGLLLRTGEVTVVVDTLEIWEELPLPV
jgi:hypothetical protein